MTSVGEPTFAQLKPQAQIDDLANYVKQDHAKRTEESRNHIILIATVGGLLAICITLFIAGTTNGVLKPPPAAALANSQFPITDSGTKVVSIRFEELLLEWQKRQGIQPVIEYLHFYVNDDTFVFTASFRTNGSAEVVEDLLVRGNLEVDGTSLLKKAVTMQATLTVEQDITAVANVGISQDLDVGGTSVFVGAVEMDASLIVASNITSLSSVQAAGTMVATGIIQSATDVRAGPISLVMTGEQVAIMCANCPLCLCCVTPPC